MPGTEVHMGNPSTREVKTRTEFEGSLNYRQARLKQSFKRHLKFYMCSILLHNRIRFKIQTSTVRRASWKRLLLHNHKDLKGKRQLGHQPAETQQQQMLLKQPQGRLSETRLPQKTSRQIVACQTYIQGQKIPFLG